MSLFQGLISGGILALITVSLAHFRLGEKMLLKSTFSKRGNAVLESDFAWIIRFAWYVTSLCWIMIVVILYSIGFYPFAMTSVILLTLGIGFLAISIFDGIASRGRHVGWPIFTFIGVFSLAAYVIGGSAT